MRGFSLLEVLVAVTIVAVGVAALAQLVGFAAHANLRARQTTTVAAVLAQQKIEELLPTTGGDLASVASRRALLNTVEGYSDFVDRTGRLLGGGPAAPAGSAYLRRWSVDPLPDSTNHTSILQVLVTDLRTHDRRPLRRRDVPGRRSDMHRSRGFSLIETAHRHRDHADGGRRRRVRDGAAGARRVRNRPRAADMQQRVRVAADTLTRDLAMAGAGAYMGGQQGPLIHYFRAGAAISPGRGRATMRRARSGPTRSPSSPCRPPRRRRRSPPICAAAR